MNVDLYLQKLHVNAQKPSLEFLNELIAAHQKLISFNNLAVFFNPGKILELDLLPLFEKVIVRGEGGYCFENNKIFYHLLLGLGFQVEAKLGRVIYDREGDLPRTHRTTIVTLDHVKYLADVGFGKDAPPHAIPLEGEKVGLHQVIKTHDLYQLVLHKKESLFKLYTFDDGHYQESDYMVGNYYTNTHPASKFTKEVIIVRREGNVLEFINGRTYTKIDHGLRTDIEIKNQKEFQDYLKHFHLYQSYDFEKVPPRLVEF